MIIKFIDFLNENIIYSGRKVWNHIIDITPEKENIPHGFKNDIINKKFIISKINLKSLLKTDQDFKEYYKSKENRYEGDEDAEYHLNIDYEIVVVNGILLDGYSRASTLLRNGETETFAYINKTS